MTATPPSAGDGAGYIALASAITVALIGAAGSWANRIWSVRRNNRDRTQDHEEQRTKAEVEADVKARLDIYSANEALIRAYREERDKLLERVGSLGTLVETLQSDKVDLLSRLGKSEAQIATLIRESEAMKTQLQRCETDSAEINKRCTELMAMVSELEGRIVRYFGGSVDGSKANGQTC